MQIVNDNHKKEINGLIIAYDEKEFKYKENCNIKRKEMIDNHDKLLNKLSIQHDSAKLKLRNDCDAEIEKLKKDHE